MKINWIIIVLSVLGTTSAGATEYANTRVSLVVKDFESDDFLVERAPIIGCYGLSQGPQLAQWTQPYLVPSNVGCGGGSKAQENINALTCARVLSAEADSSTGIYNKIVLDISKCPDKNNARFITLIRTTAARNFPQRYGSKEVDLYLVKELGEPVKPTK